VANQSDLDLAASGKDAWNDWAKKNRRVAVDFSGHVFNSDSANFEGFAFPGDANFRGCRFLGRALFSGAAFVGKADFSHTNFQAYAGLDRITFLNDAIFEHSCFEQYAYVVHTKFTYANFKAATFNGRLELTSSTCGGETDFTGATFEDATFRGVQFKHPLATFESATFNKVPDFRNSSFETPPILYGVVVGNPTSERTAEAQDADKYRCLKLLAADAKDHQGELKFFADELRAKRGHETKGSAAIWLNEAYERVSDFGQSIARPILWLVGLILVSWVVRVIACLPSSLDAIWPHFAMSLADTALLIGSEKWELRINALKLTQCSRHFDLLEHVGALFQSGAGVVLLFLIVLGLRNRFRIGSGN
jgi:uncharacterized protein YjbI with pentapeptide repeats